MAIEELKPALNSRRNAMFKKTKIKTRLIIGFTGVVLFSSVCTLASVTALWMLRSEINDVVKDWGWRW